MIRVVNSAHCAVFESTMATIGATYSFIHDEWLPGSGCVHLCPKRDFELYAPGTDAADSPVLIHIPLRRGEPSS